MANSERRARLPRSQLARATTRCRSLLLESCWQVTLRFAAGPFASWCLSHMSAMDAKRRRAKIPLVFKDDRASRDGSLVSGSWSLLSTAVQRPSRFGMPAPMSTVGTAASNHRAIVDGAGPFVWSYHEHAGGHSPPFAPIHVFCSSSSSSQRPGSSSLLLPGAAAVSPQTIPHDTTYSFQQVRSSCSICGCVAARSRVSPGSSTTLNSSQPSSPSPAPPYFLAKCTIFQSPLRSAPRANNSQPTGSADEWIAHSSPFSPSLSVVSASWPCAKYGSHDLPRMAYTFRPRKVVIWRGTEPSPSGVGMGLSTAGGCVTPASSRNVGAKSMTVEKARLKEPGRKWWENAPAGGLMMHGTRMPPCDGKHLNRRDGAVDACAQSGPSLGRETVSMHRVGRGKRPLRV
ncbi:hypothetical protein VTK73DRAFT_1510 [Phialemonium thermophilum]|uniref:Uncharacterized protein n=1 Tax=Phialemonium thermophilum TaxID=223376 RepID=A0ABR3VTB1_9PEZI